jgi:hypothetical protein
MTFYEIIDNLIGLTQVPEDKRQGDGYETARKEIHDNLAADEDVKAVCYHEAAHLIYANLVGFKGSDGNIACSNSLAVPKANCRN